MLQELRRGSERATIHCLAFSHDASLLACTSDRGTCHVFRVKEDAQDPDGVAVARAGIAGVVAAPGGDGVQKGGDGGGDEAAGGGGETSGGGGGGESGEGAAAPGAKSSEGEATATDASIKRAAPGAAGDPGAGDAAGLAGSGGGGNEDGGAAAGSSNGGKAKGDGKAKGSSAGSGGSAGNTTSGLGFLGGILPSYFSSEWSFAQFRVPAGRSICAFGSGGDSLVVVTGDGSYFKARFHGSGKGAGKGGKGSGGAGGGGSKEMEQVEVAPLLRGPDAEPPIGMAHGLVHKAVESDTHAEGTGPPDGRP